MLQLLISIIAIIITILLVVGIHEFAHFIVAKSLGIKVLRFSIGFGKAFFRIHDKSGTEYVLAWIPLGGYVKMLDETEGKVAKEELHRAFNRQPLYKKFLVVIAGPLANIFSAVFFYWLIFIIGFTTIIPVIGNVVPNSIAAQSGLKAKQEIVSIADAPALNWTGVILRIVMQAGNARPFKIEVKNPPTQFVSQHLADVSHLKIDELSPDPLKNFGIIPYEPPIALTIGMIAPDSAAAHSPLKLKDKLIAIEGKPVKNWQEIITTINKNPEKTLRFTVERQGKKITVSVEIGYQRNLFFQKSGYLGIAPYIEWPKEYLRKIQYGFLEAIPHAMQEVVNFTQLNVVMFAKMITGKISLKSLGGPITIFETAGTALNYGFLSFIAFLAFLSIAIGVINLLPIPGLDGGHLLIYIIETIMRKPLPEKVLLLLYRLGFIIILLLLFQALMNDIMRLY